MVGSVFPRNQIPVAFAGAPPAVSSPSLEGCMKGARRVRSKASGARTQVPDTLGPPPPKLRQARQGSIHSPFHSSTCSCDFGPTYDSDGLFLKKVVPPSRTLCQILPHSSPFSFFAALPPFSYCAATLATICFSPPAASPPPCEIAQSDLQSSLG